MIVKDNEITESIKVYRIYLLAAIVLVLSFQIQHLGGPLLDSYGFRQTQTAITTFWFQQKGIVFPYLTPVFGWPWSVPFEFPTYQIIVYWVAGIFQITNLDLAGRVVSLVFYYACFWPLSSILDKLNVDKKTIYIICIVTVVSPIFIFWSRTFMPESAALFFALAFIAAILKYERTGSYFNKNLLLIFIFAVLATLTKITTFLVSLCFIFLYLISYYHYKNIVTKKTLLVVLTVFSCVLIGVLWTAYTDQIKNLNPLGSDITSSNLTSWNFGSIKQRFTLQNYIRFFDFAKMNASYLLFILMLLPGFLFFDIRYKKLLLISMLTYILSFMILFNLYYVHYYYWYANSIFLSIVIGILISNIAYQIRNFILIHILLIVTISLGMFGYLGYYKKLQFAKYDKTPVMEISNILKNNTGKNDIVYIKGMDWSSELPYYSERKSIMVPGWGGVDIGNSKFDVIVKNSTKENAVTAIVVCGKNREDYRTSALNYFNFKKTIEFKYQNCLVLIKDTQG